MASRKALAGALAAALALQPAIASAQQACLTEEEVSAMAIYSVPSLVKAVRTRCDAELSASGFLARRGETLAGRYAALQNRVWPSAKSGALKYGAGKAKGLTANFDMIRNLPDSSVRPLVDALIVQEAAARVEPANCRRIEMAMEGIAVLDPEVGGTMLGVVVGLIGPQDPAFCPARRL